LLSLNMIENGTLNMQNKLTSKHSTFLRKLVLRQLADWGRESSIFAFSELHCLLADEVQECLV